ncbi:hypothetical protein GCM10009775_12450 [Microbacterium aoyamense]|uniref:Cell wall-binding protein n=1 Tax=Microbacterium aoyamense TaxID=344166 RepID=A0ABP5AW39_9MICO|nr:cell wall-binding repeat-containing protein [Microbacterium aoyamense]
MSRRPSRRRARRATAIAAGIAIAASLLTANAAHAAPLEIWPDTGPFVMASTLGPSDREFNGATFLGYRANLTLPFDADDTVSCSWGDASFVDDEDHSLAAVQPWGAGGGGLGAVYANLLIKAPASLSSDLVGRLRFTCTPIGGETTYRYANLTIQGTPSSLYHTPHQWTVGLEPAGDRDFAAVGFGAGEQVYVSVVGVGAGEWDDVIVRQVVTADGAGGISGDFDLPSDVWTGNEELAVVATGVGSRYTLQAWLAPEDLSFDATLGTRVIGETTSPSGKAVRVNLTGYDPRASVVVALHSTAAPVVLGTVTTDSTGAAAASLNVPAGVSGAFTVWAGEKTVGYLLKTDVISIPTTAPADLTSRLSGTGRYDTAVAISAATFPTPGVPVAYIANGMNFPDALAGAPAAGMNGGPVLLSPANELPAAVAAELDRLQPQRIIVLGGKGAISESVLQELESHTDGSVDRVSGAGRYDTAVEISKETFPTSGVPVLYIASGVNFPDALAGAPAAGINSGPVLLTPPSSVPASVIDEITRLDPARIVVLGGSGAVSASVMTQLQGLTDGGVTRLSGTGRYDTAVAISKATFEDPGVPVAYIANGMNFPDALAGAPAAGVTGGPVLLTPADSLPGAVVTELTRLQPGKIVVLGGSGAVSANVLNQLEDLVAH